MATLRSVNGNVSLLAQNGAITATAGTGAAAVTIGSVTQRVVATTTDTILAADRQNRVAYNSASAVAVTLPQAGSSGFAGGFNTRLSNQAAGTVTVTPTTSTINGNATLVILEGQDCFITPSSTGTNWAADCNEPQMTAGNGISFTRGVHSLTITNSAAGAITNNVIPKGTGTSLTNSSITDNGTTVSATEPFSSTGTITSGANGGTAGQIILNGSTSGSATITANATAGTVTVGGAGTLTVSTINANSLYSLNGRNWAANTAPTISSGFGTSPTIVTSNGSITARINVGTGGTASSGVLAMGTVTNNWNCQVYNLTAHAGNRVDDTVMTASTTNSVTVQNQTKSTGAALAWTASDIVVVNCAAE